MSPKQVDLLFWMGLLLTVVGVLALYVIAVEMTESELYVTKTIFYLSALSTLFLGWKKIDHRFPGRNKE